ncbi:MAG: polysaccharide deacetylase family protein [Pirellulales bacterium]|nr:polysaccharide deacetylase family protein [Pirellulales bacterium]
MNWCKSTLLNLYYAGTLYARKRAMAGHIQSGRMPIIVLFYHRVANKYPNNWTINTRTFAAQMAWLKKRFDLVPLSEAQRRIASGANRQPTVSITFDDGYADNCSYALPLLFQENIPFTYFVTTDFLFKHRPFPHDVAAGQPLEPNTPEQIQELADLGADIGAHTRTHANLGAITEPEQLRDELISGKRALEDFLGKFIRYFAFPFGCHKNLTPEAFRMAHEAGYEGVCSAYGGYNFPGDDPYHLQRIHGDPEWIRFKNWMTIDPRKLQSIIRYDSYGTSTR